MENFILTTKKHHIFEDFIGFCVYSSSRSEHLSKNKFVKRQLTQKSLAGIRIILQNIHTTSLLKFQTQNFFLICFRNSLVGVCYVLGVVLIDTNLF